jgi:hypothetical protein
MARERTPEGKRVVIPVRVSEPKAEAIDKARGETPRSVWVEGAIDAELSRFDRDGQPVASTAHTDVGTGAAEPASEAPCEHRIPPGSFCTRCGRLI